MKKTKRLEVLLSKEQDANLAADAKSLDVSKAHVVRMLLRERFTMITFYGQGDTYKVIDH